VKTGATPVGLGRLHGREHNVVVGHQRRKYSVCCWFGSQGDVEHQCMVAIGGLAARAGAKRANVKRVNVTLPRRDRISW
jgi:hypothetical protein